MCFTRPKDKTKYLLERDRRKIESLGFGITGVVTDGRPGIKGVFNGIPVQMCHFHQRQIITRHLTTRPKLEASVELRVIAQTLCNTTEEERSEERRVGKEGRS